MNPLAAGIGYLTAATLATAPVAAGPPDPAAGTWRTQARYLMGTVWTIEAQGRDVDRAIDEAFTEIRRLDALLSTYRPESALSRVNREAGRRWVGVSSETRELLERSLGYWRRSGGAFDPTVGALVRLWGFKYRDYRVPAAAEIDAAREKVGAGHLRVDPARGVRFARSGLEVDLGAIAKGYAVDRALERLRAGGIRAARVDAGGNQGVFGPSPAGGAWSFGIRHPRAEGEILGVTALARGAISTSGDAERGFWRDGVRYGHIIDPQSGRPVRGMLSVTVVAPTAEQADALSTALYVLGTERGTRLLEEYPDCHALFVAAGSGPGDHLLAKTAGFDIDIAAAR
ncbi:MAG: FAD:protein FMN transferase [Candidatus Sericytochromatia bacterium]|nr:FAD:protein FMN transferase [Candidatus Tanganyikabacteria bacterium]